MWWPTKPDVGWWHEFVRCLKTGLLARSHSFALLMTSTWVLLFGKPLIKSHSHPRYQSSNLFGNDNTSQNGRAKFWVRTDMERWAQCKEVHSALWLNTVHHMTSSQPINMLDFIYPYCNMQVAAAECEKRRRPPADARTYPDRLHDSHILKSSLY